MKVIKNGRTLKMVNGRRLTSICDIPGPVGRPGRQIDIEQKKGEYASLVKKKYKQDIRVIRHEKTYTLFRGRPAPTGKASKLDEGRR